MDASKEYTEKAKEELLNSIDGKVDNKYTEKIGSKLTHIGDDGIYTGTIAADKIVGLTIDASQITTGKLTSNHIDVENLSVKEAINLKGKITADNIDAGVITIGKINGLQAELDGKASTSSVSTLNTTISNLDTKVNSIETNVATKATLTDVINTLSSAPSGSTTINGGWINTNAITITPSQLVDNDNKPVTIITPGTLATIDVLAERLQVNAANIKNKLTAEQIEVENLVISGGNIDTSKNSMSGLSINANGTTLRVDNDNIYIKTNDMETEMTILEFIQSQYKIANYETIVSEYRYRYSIGDDMF